MQLVLANHAIQVAQHVVAQRIAQNARRIMVLSTIKFATRTFARMELTEISVT
mgnify:CR=1 FL=1